MAFVRSHLDAVPANPEMWEMNPFKFSSLWLHPELNVWLNLHVNVVVAMPGYEKQELTLHLNVVVLAPR